MLFNDNNNNNIYMTLYYTTRKKIQNTISDLLPTNYLIGDTG